MNTTIEKSGRCKDLGLNLLECIQLLKSNQNLMKLISDTTNNPLSVRKPALDKATIDGFIGKYIFPYSLVPDVEKDTNNFITVSYAQIRPGQKNPESKQYFLQVNFYCHKDLAMFAGGIRALSIHHEIDKQLNDVLISSVGKIKFVESRSIDVKSIYHGYSIIYEITDFN